MGCKTIYDEMMSLKLDGLLDTKDERHLLAHVANCDVCAPFWDAMKEADVMLLASSREPVLMPSDFAVKVMGRIAQTTVVRPQVGLETELASATAFDMPRPTISVLPQRMPAFGGYETLPQAHMPEYVVEWQNRIGAYVRGMTAVGLSILGAAGLLLAAVITGSLQVGGPITPVVQVVRTFIVAAETWVRALAANVGSDVAIGGMFALALLGVAGWQIVTNYHHSTVEHWLDAPIGEAA